MLLSLIIFLTNDMDDGVLVQLLGTRVLLGIFVGRVWDVVGASDFVTLGRVL
jgi:hypothetical protein